MIMRVLRDCWEKKAFAGEGGGNCSRCEFLQSRVLIHERLFSAMPGIKIWRENETDKANSLSLKRKNAEKRLNSQLKKSSKSKQNVIF
jgi:hypothetical protein